MARPPTTWPSASIGRPASVVSVIANFSPRSRSAVTAVSIACAASGSSQSAEGEHAVRRLGVRHQADVADDLRLVVAGGPGHQDLRLRAQQRIDAVDLGAAGDDLVARIGLGDGEPLARAHQHDRRHHGEAEDRQRDRHADDLVAVEQREGVEVGVDDRRRAAGRARESAGTVGRALAAVPADRNQIESERRWRRRCGIRRAADEPYGPRRRSGSCPAYPIAPIRRIPGGPKCPPLEPQSLRRAAPTCRYPTIHGRPRINGL